MTDKEKEVQQELRKLARACFNKEQFMEQTAVKFPGMAFSLHYSGLTGMVMSHTYPGLKSF